MSPRRSPSVRASVSRPSTHGPDTADELEDDELEDDELEGDELEEDDEHDDEGAAAAPPAPPSGASAAAAPPSPRPLRASQARARAEARRDAFTVPMGAAYARAWRLDAGDRRAPCVVLDRSSGIVHERMPLPLTAATLLDAWGSGRFVLQYHRADGRLCGAPSPVTLDHPSHPPRALDPRTGHVVHEVGGPTAPTAAPSPPAPPPAPPMPPRPPAPTPGQGLTFEGFLQWQEYFRQTAQAEADARVLRIEREAEIRMQRMRAESELEAERQRQRYALELQEANERHARSLEHVKTISQEMLSASRAAVSTAPLQRRIDALEAELEGREGLTEQLAPLLAPVVEMIVSRRFGGSTNNNPGA